ncbi:MAG: zinc ribbon domain-containing protein [Ruminococcus sp.]|nr:zinc ribbon domain-containing protein [Ruminococcus sp.]
MDFTSFIPLITVLVIIGAVVAGVLAVRSRVRRFSREMFGNDSLIKGYMDQKKTVSESPVSVRSMTSIYLPQIKKDFPEFDYELYKNKAQSVLRSYFTAVSSKNVLALTEECSNTLKNTVTGIIEDLDRRDLTQVFAETVIHDVQIARYIKNGATVTVLFNASVGCYNYLEDAAGTVVLGSKEFKHQSIYDIALVYVQDARKMGVAGDSGIGLNCPNCGAPIRNLGQKFCEHCGSGVVEANIRVWSFDEIKEQTVGKKAY